MVDVLERIGLPFAYDHFAKGEAPEPPYICYRLPRSNNFCADGKVYVKADDINIELYTETKDPALEARIEDVLDGQGLFYEKSEVYIESEGMYEVIYYLGGINTWQIK